MKRSNYRVKAHGLALSRPLAGGQLDGPRSARGKRALSKKPGGCQAECGRPVKMYYSDGHKVCSGRCHSFVHMIEGKERAKRKGAGHA